MQAFDIEQMRTLVAVVDSGSVTAGAARVHLSQSSVSEQLRKLEDRAGHALLVRSRSGVVPTPAGRRLLDYARRLLVLSDEAWRDLHGVTLQGELRFAVTDYFRPASLAPLLARLGREYPGVRLRVTVCKSQEVEAGLAAGHFDVGVSMRLPGPGGRARPLCTESLCWIAAPAIRLRATEPLRLLALPDDCALHRFTIGLLARRRRPYEIVHIASGVAGLQSALVAGLGVACLNESAIVPGIVRLPSGPALPALPQVGFHLLGGHRGDDPFIARVRALLTSLLQAPVVGA